MSALKPVVQPPIPATGSANPIDAFIAAELKAKGLMPVGPADKLTLLRRVYFDLDRYCRRRPPNRTRFSSDASPDAYDKSSTSSCRANNTASAMAGIGSTSCAMPTSMSAMLAAPGIHLWRDWVITLSINDMPYDQFVRTQLTGYRYDGPHADGGHRRPLARWSRGPTTCSRSASWRAAT